MIPWRKLPKDAQRAILAMMLLSGEAAAASCSSPMVCDPPPPPSVAPRLTPAVSPIICDPAPPPATSTPTATPTATPTVTPALPPTETPMIFDPPPPPATATPARPPVETPMICDPPPPPATPSSKAIEGAKVAKGAGAPLPLAEIRSVTIFWDDSASGPEDALVFEAGSPWAGARYRWSASGGRLDDHGDRVAWQPPQAAGRCLLQVVADWDSQGLAVDALVLVVGEDGSVTAG